MNQRAIEQKMDPISGVYSPSNPFISSRVSDVVSRFLSGITSEGYKGKGFVTHK